MERVNLNSNEKLAMMTTGMEGTGEHFIMNGETADRILAELPVAMWMRRERLTEPSTAAS